MEEKIKILIADDHPVIRRGLSMVINCAKNLEVIGEAENGEIALHKIQSLRPDIIVLDIDMPVLDGIETAKIINVKYPKVKIVFLSMHKEKEILNSMLKLNLMGYVLKDGALMEIVDCLNQVSKGETYISPVINEISNNSIEDASYESNLTSPLSVLSLTELQILRRVSDAKTSREIAEELFISVRTVENHRFNICSKLNIRGNHALFKFSLDNKEFILARIREK